MGQSRIWEIENLSGYMKTSNKQQVVCTEGENQSCGGKEPKERMKEQLTKL